MSSSSIRRPRRAALKFVAVVAAARYNPQTHRSLDPISPMSKRLRNRRRRRWSFPKLKWRWSDSTQRKPGRLLRTQPSLFRKTLLGGSKSSSPPRSESAKKLKSTSIPSQASNRIGRRKIEMPLQENKSVKIKWAGKKNGKWKKGYFGQTPKLLDTTPSPNTHRVEKSHDAGLASLLGSDLEFTKLDQLAELMRCSRAGSFSYGVAMLT